MDKGEFKRFCNEEFVKRGFKKHKSTYYFASEQGLLCGLTLQKSYGSGYYINCDFFVGYYDNPKSYPTQYESDLSHRAINVLSKVTYKGEYFMTPLIMYEKYTANELRPYFTQAFDQYIMPPLYNGKQELLQHLDIWQFPHPTVKSEKDILEKLRN